MIGGPYALMQCYAWLGMIVTYSQDGGLVRATRDTFSGEKPCALCHKIASAKAADQENDSSPAETPPSPERRSGDMVPLSVLEIEPPELRTVVVSDGFAVVRFHGRLREAPLSPPPCIVA